MSSLADNSFKSRAQYVSAVRTSRDPAFASRIQFWIDFLGDKDITGITADDVEDGLNALRQRGKKKVIVDRNGNTRTEITDKALSNATLNLTRQKSMEKDTKTNDLTIINLLHFDLESASDGFAGHLQKFKRQPVSAGHTIPRQPVEAPARGQWQPRQ